MARRRDVVVMHHPDTGRQITALNDKQAAIYERSGWKRGEAPKKAAKAADKES